MSSCCPAAGPCTSTSRSADAPTSSSSATSTSRPPPSPRRPTAKVTNELGVAMVTTGPGGTNAVTGVASAWLDSMPCLVISGQVKRDDLKRDSGVRILGVQEIDIVSIVDSITKYAVTIEDPSTIRYHLEKAVHLAHDGRRGPVWIDIPLDVQAAQIDPDRASRIQPADREGRRHDLDGQVGELLGLLRSSERPVIVAGNGIRAAGAVERVPAGARDTAGAGPDDVAGDGSAARDPSPVRRTSRVDRSAGRQLRPPELRPDAGHRRRASTWP